MLGPSGPRRLRLAVEHLAQHRGGICFCIDLDPRWVIKLIKKGWMEHLEAYKQHCIDQAITILGAGHDVKCMFGTPKLIEALPGARRKGQEPPERTGITGIFSGGTEFTPQWTRFAHRGTSRRKSGIYMTPTYGNTLMGLACRNPYRREGYKISYYAPQPRAVVEVVDFDDTTRVVGYGETGRVKLTTLTKEFFMPGFLERDEGEREPPCEQYPWDGISGMRPFRALGRSDDRRRLLRHEHSTHARNSRHPLGPAVRLARSRRGESTSPPASRSPRSARRTAGSSSATCARRSRPATRCARFPIDDLIAMLGKAADLYERHAADGRRHAVARRLRASAVGEHRAARAHVPGEHGEELVRAQEHGEDSDVAHARARLDILTRGYGEEGAGVTVSYQAQIPVLGRCCRRIRRACIRCGCR